jgi:hypothetical protein
MAKRNLNLFSDKVPAKIAVKNAAGEFGWIGAEDALEVANTWPHYGALGEPENKSDAELAAAIGIILASASGPGSMDFAEDTDNGTNKVQVKAPASLGGDRVLILPNVDHDLTSFKQQIPIPAWAITPTPTSGAEAGVHTNGVNYLAFSDSADEYGLIQLVFPGRWDGGTVTAQYRWMHPSTTTNFSVCWGMQGVSIGDNEDITASLGTGVTVTDEGGTTDRHYISPESAPITLAGATVGDTQLLRVYRDVDGNGTATDDDLAVKARLIEVILTFTANKLKDA